MPQRTGAARCRDYPPTLIMRGGYLDVADFPFFLQAAIGTIIWISRYRTFGILATMTGRGRKIRAAAAMSHERGPERPGFHLRRLDDLLRLDGGDRVGDRPPRWVLPALKIA